MRKMLKLLKIIDITRHAQASKTIKKNQTQQKPINSLTTNSKVIN